MGRKKLTIIPKRGYVKEIADEAGCDPHYVTKALHHGATGPTADKVREIYKRKYG